MTNADKLKASLDSEDVVMLIKNSVLDLDMCKCCIQTKGSCNGYGEWAIRKGLESECEENWENEIL